MPPIKIAANIMDSDLTRIGEQVEELQKAGADLLHMDIMDGHYVPAFVGGPRMLSAIKKVAEIPVDVHLMVSNPDIAVEWFLDAGADLVSFHHEAAEDATVTIGKIKGAGARAGLALRPEMEAGWLAQSDFAEELDYLLAMTVVPGRSGQKFMESGCGKIPEIRRTFGEDIDVFVDGGINATTIKSAAGYGANAFATASAIFKSASPYKDSIARLREAAESAYEGPAENQCNCRRRGKT